MQYVYSWIRFVPNPFVGECINLGAVVGSDSPRDWKMRTLEDHARGAGLDSKALLPQVFACLEVMFSPTVMENIDEPMLTSWHSAWFNVVQLSRPATIEAESAEAGLDVLFRLQENP